jgi:hypothetical protein
MGNTSPIRTALLIALITATGLAATGRAPAADQRGRRTTVLDKYHRGETTQAINPDKDAGKISDLGK